MTIEVDHVYKSYDGKTVLSDFSLDIESGKSYLISAPSGSGKTTLLRIILGLEKPDRGSIRLLGDYKYSGLNAGVVFQEDRLCEDCSAAVNTAMVNRRISITSAKEEGMRRRVCIVRACIIPSDIIILDEPFAGLDRVNRQKAIQYILDAKGTTPLVITDHSAEGLDFCRKVTFGSSDTLS